jgi:hypothetical protein
MPEISRWTQPDPVGGNPMNPMSLDPYLYVQDNPTTFTDPTGLMPLEYESESVFEPTDEPVRMLGVDEIYVGPPYPDEGPSVAERNQAGLETYQGCFETALDAPAYLSGVGALWGTAAGPAGTAGGAAGGLALGGTVTLFSPAWCLFPAAYVSGR